MDAVSSTALPRNIITPDIGFLAVLQARESGMGGPVGLLQLSSLLWHATAMRSRHPSGRFGIPWESRAAPSAGGLHPIRIVCIPVGEGHAGLYDPSDHSLAHLRGDDPKQSWNAQNVKELTGATAGVTLQFAGDCSKLDACYENSGSLLWRDAGALAATICLVASALGMSSVVMGRHGDCAVASAGLPPRFRGVGAVHVGSRADPGVPGSGSDTGS